MASFRACVAAAALSLTACAEADFRADRSITPFEARQRLSIGVLEGSTPYEFGRLINAVKLSDGRVVAADYANSEVRMFAPDGSYLMSLGRKGAGPGEFLALTRLGLTLGDTLLAGGNTRIARFTANGVLVNDVQVSVEDLATMPWRVEAVWPLAGGRYLVKLIGPPPVVNEDGLERSPELYVVSHGPEDPADSLGVFLGLGQLTYDWSSEERSAIPVIPVFTRAAISRHDIVIGDMAADSVLRYSIATGERRWIKLPLEKHRLNPEQWEQAKSRICARWSDPQRCVEDQEALPDQLKLPYYSAIAVDSIGQVWVRPNKPETILDSTAMWVVFGVHGEPVGTTALPSNVEVTQIGASYVLGMSRDSLGVQRVEEFTISR